MMITEVVERMVECDGVMAAEGSRWKLVPSGSNVRTSRRRCMVVAAVGAYAVQEQAQMD
jgi:hypothetical protein